LKGIDKGGIVSSGAPQISKEGSLGWNSTDYSHPRRAKLGTNFQSFFFYFFPHFADTFSRERK